MPTKPTAGELRTEREAMQFALQLVTTITVAPYLASGAGHQVVSRVAARAKTEERFEYYYQLALTKLLFHLAPLAGDYRTDGLHGRIVAVLDTAAGLVPAGSEPGSEPDDVARESTIDRPVQLRDVVRTMMHAGHRTFDLQAAVAWAAMKGTNHTGEVPVSARMEVLADIAYQTLYGDLGEPWTARGDLA